MIQAIVYTSNTGSTERYAKLLGHETDLPVYSLEEAKKNAETAGEVQESVEEARDKVIEAIDSLKKLTAQAQIDKAKYDALVEQYNQAMETYKEALAAADGLDEKLGELEKAVRKAIEAAQSHFDYVFEEEYPDTTLNGNTGGQTETDGIEDENVPLSADDSADNGGGTENIDDESVPLAAGEDQQTGIGTAGIAGIIAAARAPFLLLYKKKKDEEEEEKENTVN